MEFLAVIPARGGSKRLPRKNILELGGKPLIYYSIEAVTKSKLVSNYVVSTDDYEIADTARELGGNVPFLRPAKISGDAVRNSSTLKHALGWFEENCNQNFDAVILLQPTAPLRQSWHIDEAIRLFEASQANTLASVTGPHRKRDVIVKKMNSRCLLSNYASEDNNRGFYTYNASIYIVSVEYLLEFGSFTSDHEVGYVMDQCYSVDIDNEFDFNRAKCDLNYIREKGLCEL